MKIGDRKSTRLNSSHLRISYAVFCLKKKRRGRRGTDSMSGCGRTTGGMTRRARAAADRAAHARLRPLCRQAVGGQPFYFFFKNRRPPEISPFPPPDPFPI